MAFLCLPDLLFLGALEPLLSPEVAAVLEHVGRVRMQGPEAPLSRFVGSPGHLYEAVVETEAVPDGVLPPLLVLAVIREGVHYELVDLREGEHLGGVVVDGHGDEGYVGVRGLGLAERPAELLRPGLLRQGHADVHLSGHGVVAAHERGHVQGGDAAERGHGLGHAGGGD